MIAAEKQLLDGIYDPSITKEASRCTTVAIASGKGGVGKTCLAVNLAISLAQEGKQVMLFDADMGLANVDLIMNADCRYSILNFLNGSKDLDEIITVGYEGVEVICGVNGIDRLADISDFERQRIICQLDKLNKTKEFVLIDTGAGIQKNVISFCMAADVVVVVATPEPTAITDAYATIKVLVRQKYDGKICLVVNMADDLGQGKLVYRQISAVALKFLNVTVLEGGTILRDSLFCESVKSRKPLVLGYPYSKSAKSINNIALRLTKNMSSKKIEDGFFRRVVKKFF